VSFSPGEVVRLLDGDVYLHPTRESIRTAPDVHIDDEFGRYTNHSVNPTCKVEGGCLVALVQINPGGEITFNYIENEEKILASPFVDLETGEPVGFPVSTSPDPS